MKEKTRALRELEATAQQVGQLIGPAFEENDACFALLGFSKGAGGWTTYVSNARRDDMIKALREMADVMEAGLDAPPPGGRTVE